MTRSNAHFLRLTVLAAIGLRAAPLVVWGELPCMRDECTYIQIADRFLAGQGMTDSAGWLWAPGYSAWMATLKGLTGSFDAVRVSQIGFAAINTVLVFLLAGRLVGERAAKLAALLYALSPSLAFFAISLWSETIYTTFLLAAVLALDYERDQASLRWAAAAGACIGFCILFRGIATYMIPCFILGLLWGRWRSAPAWGRGIVLSLTAGAVVAPYSVYISAKYDAFIVSDRTLGQMMWLGNNTYEPLTFDYGYGQESLRAIRRYVKTGRPACAPQSAPIERDECQTQAGIDWIREHPDDFLRRVPLRLAQTLSPHSFLTRHVRWERWRPMPLWLGETLIVLGAASSAVAMLVGAFGLVARGSGGTAGAIGAIVVYHLAAIPVTAGLSRYRVPFEPLLLIYASAALCQPRSTLAALRTSPPRAALGLLTLLVVIPLVLWFLPSGWPGWGRW